jgi:hypothetical protein
MHVAKVMVCVAGLTLATVGSAAAQEAAVGGEASGSAMGVGAVAMLNGPAGAAFVWDGGPWRIEGILGVADGGGATVFDVGGRFWFGLHRAASADLSVGGGLGFRNISVDGGDEDDDTTALFIELGAQIRAFLVPNVAFSSSFGLVVLGADADGFFVDGQRLGDDGDIGFSGGVGVVYYFR